MRVIEYDAVYQYAFEGVHGGGLEDGDFDAIINAIDSVPAVDAVEVPCRCKACAFSEQDRPSEPMVCRKWSTKRGTVYTSPDGYCHKGKPKEVEGK